MEKQILLLREKMKTARTHFSMPSVTTITDAALRGVRVGKIEREKKLKNTQCFSFTADRRETV